MLKEFPTKQAAHDFAVARPNFIFARDVHEKGAKRYIACDLDTFIETYLIMRKSSRMHYEVIPDDIPLKLYFDVEFERADHPLWCEDAIVQRIVDSVRLETKIPNLVLFQLDASNEKKASRHLIFPLVFPNKPNMKLFVNHLIEVLRSSASPITAKGTVCGIDPSVYDHDRCFRLYGSHKMGHIARTFYPILAGCKVELDSLDPTLFRQLLISYIDHDVFLPRYTHVQVAAPENKKKRNYSAVGTTTRLRIHENETIESIRLWLKTTYPEYTQAEAQGRPNGP